MTPRHAGRRRQSGQARSTAGRVAPIDILVRDVEIESLAAGGDGVGRADGLVVFTPRTAPGDRARVEITPARGGRFGRGRLLDLLVPSRARVAPPCRHFMRDQCGGCQLQHVSYDAQLQAKGAMVRDALVRIGRRSIADVAVTASPSTWRYRRKLTLALRQTAPGHWTAGLHRFDDPTTVFPLEECPITEDRILAVWRAAMDIAHLLPDAPALRASIRETTNGYALVVEGGADWRHGVEFAAALPVLTEVWWKPDDGPRRAIGARDAQKQPAREASPSVSADDHRTGASFIQVNAALSDILHADVVRRALAYTPTTAVDAYAGTGRTAVALAEHGVRVTAIEADAAAAGYCHAALPSGSRCIANRVEEALPGTGPTDIVLLNPPRAGLAKSVTAHLQTANPAPRAIIYVSCDPATLARDVASLPGWRIVHVQGYDMFPQTAHVETLCELIPDRTAA